MKHEFSSKAENQGSRKVLWGLGTAGATNFGDKMQKPNRTNAELKAMIMQEVRMHPEFRSIDTVAIDGPHQRTPNWGFAWIVDGARLAPLGAYEIARQLQRQFDLI
jgi:hypothetical protein